MRHIHGVYPFKPSPAPQADPARPELASDDEPLLYLPMGPFSEFRGLVQRHYIATEHALAGDDAQDHAPADPYLLGDVELFE